MFQTVLQGFMVTMSLTVAIGAQNAFVLKQGLKQQHILLICLLCALSDTILIMAGVFGFSQLDVQQQAWVNIIKYIGAAFLFVYGAQHFYRALYVKQQMDEAEHQEAPVVKILMMCLAFTWLNPHAYLDTMLIGAISVNFGDFKYVFALGAVLASWTFFFCLGYGARLLKPWFNDYRAWKILDVIIAVTMWSIAYSLV
jgi:L-lysine exporter family protein LysE/ArgO